MHMLIHDIPRYFILFPEQLVLIFNQMLSIELFGTFSRESRIYF